MQGWTHEPEDGPTVSPTRLLRVRPGKPITGIITSTQLMGKYVHYWHGRTTPCTNSECPACTAKQLKRWYGWLSLWAPRTTAHVIIEITGACVDALKEYARTHGQIRAAELYLARTTAKPNSRLEIRVTESSYRPDAIPDALDVVHVLEHIWETHHATPAAQAEQRGDEAHKLRLA